MAQKYSGWFLEKLFPVWLFMFFYHGFYSGNGELNSKNRMKHVEWFPPCAKHTFTTGKEMPVCAVQTVASASAATIGVQRGAGWLLSSPGTFSYSGGCHHSLERGTNRFDLLPHRRSRSHTGIADEACQGVWPLSLWEHRGAGLFLASQSENWNV